MKLKRKIKTSTYPHPGVLDQDAYILTWEDIIFAVIESEQRAILSNLEQQIMEIKKCSKKKE